MPNGYTIECMQKLVNENKKLLIRNNLSSYLNPNGNSYWEKKLREFLDTNKDKVELYTCLEWQSTTDLKEMNNLPYLTHLQINQGTWSGNPAPKSMNPTEDPLCDLPGFSADNYISWIQTVDKMITNTKVTLVIPFKWGNQSSISSPCFGKIMTACASIQNNNGRPFALETTFYPFWDKPGVKPRVKPTLEEVENGIQWRQKLVDTCKDKYNLSQLSLVIAETGWPAHVDSGCTIDPNLATLANAVSYFKSVLSYKPTDSNLRIYYWQFQDLDNGDGCGKTWGIINPQTCQFI